MLVVQVRRLVAITSLLAVICSPRSLAEDPTSVGSPEHYPAAKSLGDVDAFGSRIQRTMTLLATSTPQRRHTVKILFYGQSITEQHWWQAVADDLRRRFPHAHLIIENRAIGGFSAERLVKTAESDLYPFYPDLVVFHVYGSHLEYENIIRRIRERTTAEIMLQTDHFSANDDLEEPVNPQSLSPQQWNAWMNYAFIPSLAERYQAELVQLRPLWRQYLLDHNLTPRDLLKDDVHLNDHGCYLMAEIVKAHLQHRPDATNESWREWTKDYVVGHDVHWRDGTLTVDFEGNRVDAVCNGDREERASVTIDGRRPSEIPELYVRTRSTAFPDSAWPCLLKTSGEAPPVAEEVTVTLTDVADDMSTFNFHVSGSVTGEDGRGQSDKRFVSDSGRVVIEPEDWNFAYARETFHRTVDNGFQVRWKIQPLGVDVLAGRDSAEAGIESTVTLAQGLSAGPHRLTLTAEGGAGGVSTIRVYRPPGFQDGR